MRKIITLLLFIIIYSCEKEDPINLITPMPGWSVERLNEDYYIQIPKNYCNNGSQKAGFCKVNPDKDIILYHFNCSDYFVLPCCGDTLEEPFPNEITGLPGEVASSFMRLNNIDLLVNSDSILTGIMYFTNRFIDEERGMSIRHGKYYKLVGNNYISMLYVTYNTIKTDTVEMICNSITRLSL